MTREAVLEKLRAHKAELRAQGVLHAALFGSLARGDHGAESDIDLMVEMDRSSPVTLWAYAGAVDYVRQLLGPAADVSERFALKDHVRPSAERDAVYAF